MSELEMRTLTAIQNFCRANTPTKQDLRAQMTMAVLPEVTRYFFTSLDDATGEDTEQLFGGVAPATTIAAAAVGIADETIKLLSQIK